MSFITVYSFISDTLRILLSLQVLLIPQLYNSTTHSRKMVLSGDRKTYILSGINDGFDMGWLEHAYPYHYNTPGIPTTEIQDVLITNWIVKCHSNGIILGPKPIPCSTIPLF